MTHRFLLIAAGLLAVTLAASSSTRAATQTFTTVGSTTWTVPAGVTSVSVLVVGGGGGGGAHIGGGGGGGGVVYNSSYAVSPGQQIAVTVGGGGSGGYGGASAGGYAPGSNGQNSSFGGLTAIGGGGGGGAYSNGGNGGSSGGAGGVGNSPGGNTSGQGFNGGDFGEDPWRGGGGGGAGANGQHGGDGSNGGNGVTYLGYTVGGGGGGGNDTGGSNPYSQGGIGGGGTGTWNGGNSVDNPGGNGTPNTGGGGGGGGGGWCSGGSGGSGLVVVSYTASAANGITWNSINLPSTGTTGQTISFTASVTNSGTTSWGALHDLELKDQNGTAQWYANVAGPGPGVGTTASFNLTLPTTAGTYTYYFKAVQQGIEYFGPVQTRTITVNAPGGQAPAITSGTSASAVVGSPFSYQITATNSPTSFGAAGLPAGLTVNPSNGLISGTPTAATTASATISATNGNGTGQATLTITVSAPGGQTQTFTSSGTFTVPAGVTSVSVLVVGGGGGGGWHDSDGGGGGGGGGGVVFNSSYAVSTGQQIPVTVGIGGAPGTGISSFPLNGGNSIFGSITAIGGGAGGNWNHDTGWNGGSGGGGTDAGNSPGGSGTAGQGNNGGAGARGSYYAAGGGGGAGSAGANGNGATGAGGAGGSGYAYAGQQYGAGGGGGTNASSGAGPGGSGAGSGGSTTTVATSAANSRGGGGGGSGHGNGNPGSGGSGVVIVTYNTSNPPPVITSLLSASATAGAVFSYQITASNTPTSFNATGLPAGLSVNTANGVISGTPTVAGTSNVTIMASNSGGTGQATLVLTVNSAGSNSVQFTNNGTFTVPAGVTSVAVLVVGGGGGGGWHSVGGGGGGGGGVVYNASLSVTPGQQIPVVVGGGGAAGVSYSGFPNDGQSSSFGGITAYGGGAGGNWNSDSGKNGGSGGGGTYWYSAPGGAGTPGQGNNGGAGNFSSPGAGGGGGGAGGAGGSANGPAAAGGGGGAGYTFNGVVYGSGGGGGGMSSGATGGPGAGNGGNSSVLATAGAPNRGGGGGGSGTGVGGAGGSGVVIVVFGTPVSGQPPATSLTASVGSSSVTGVASAGSAPTLGVLAGQLFSVVSVSTDSDSDLVLNQFDYAKDGGVWSDGNGSNGRQWTGAGAPSNTLSKQFDSAASPLGAGSYLWRARGKDNQNQFSSYRYAIVDVYAQPSATAATAIGTNGFTANWTPTTSATGYRLDVATDSNFTAMVSGYQDLPLGNVTSWPVSGLLSNAAYYYRVRAVNNAGAGANSNSTLVTTANSAALAAPQAQPASAILATSFTASWSPVSGATSYLLDVATDVNFSSYLPAYQSANVGTATSVTVSSLTPGATYYYRVRAANGSGPSPYSFIQAATMGNAYTEGSGPGLRGDYYYGTAFDSFSHQNNGERIDFPWDDQGPMVTDEFSVRWTGRFMPRYTGNYTFITTSDDGVRLWVGDDPAPKIDNWTLHGTTENYSAPVALTAGVLYEVKMEFFENYGGAVAKLEWQGTQQAREIIPLNCLYLPGGQQNPVASANSSGSIGVPWSPLGFSSGGSSNGRFEFAVAGYTNFQVTPWTPEAAGTYTFYVMRRGDANYETAISSPYTLTVGAAGIPTTFSFTGGPNFAYDGTAKSVSATPNPAVATFTQSGTFSATNVGSYTATATATNGYSGTGSYSWSIGKANQSAVSVSPTSQSIAVNASVTFTASGGSSSAAYTWGGSASGTGTTKTVTFPNAGTYSVTVQRPGDANYNDSNTAAATITVGSGGPGDFSTGLINHWRMDEGTGLDVSDSVGSAHGSFVNGPTWVPGKIGPFALGFSAANTSHVVANQPADSPYLGALTIAGWVNISAGGGDAVVASKVSSSGAQYNPFDFIATSSGGLYFVRANGSYCAWVSSATSSGGGWHHVAVVAPDANVNTPPIFYIDGALAGTVNITLGSSGPVTGDGSPIRLGRRADGAAQLNGSLDDVRIYNRALTAADIAALKDYSGPTGTAPQITQQPVSQAVAAGASATFTVTATGTPAPAFQWKKNGGNIPGATDSSLVVNPVTTADAGSYTVTATNSVNAATSNAAVLTVLIAPQITNQPSAQTVNVGDSVTFTAAASGTPAPVLQWQKNGVNLTGATGGSFTINPVAISDAGFYTLVATNAAGSATSNFVALTVNPADIASNLVGWWKFDEGSGSSAADSAGGNTGAITTPVWTTGPVGSAALSFNGSSAHVNVGAPPSLNLSAVNKFTLSAWVYPTATPNGSGVISESYGSGGDSTVQYELGFDMDAGAGGEARAAVGFYDAATGGWRVVKDSVNVSLNTWTFIAGTWDGTALKIYKNGALVNSTNPGGALPSAGFGNVRIGRRHDDYVTYMFPGKIDDPRIYTRALSAADIGALHAYTGSSVAAPQITTPPVSQTVAVGASATFSAVASGVPVPTFQWQKNGVNVPGATNPALTLTAVNAADAGSYTLTAANFVGSATSSPATLTVGTNSVMPTITLQPANQSAAVGGGAAFKVKASGYPLPTYQWRKGGVALVNGGAVAGATSPTLVLTNISSAAAGSYDVVVSNSAGTVVSSSATLTVMPSGDNGQPQLKVHIP